jgi:uncharacterized membrane protein
MYRKDDQIMPSVISVILAILFYIYFRGNRAKAIISIFSKESERQRKRGHFFLIVYVIALVIIIFALMFYKPGYLMTW